MWQEIIVGICVLVAAIVVITRILPSKASGSCGSGCGGCVSKPACSRSEPSKADNNAS